MGQGPINAFSLPSHSIDVQLMGEGDIEILSSTDENLSSASGVFGILTGSGTLDVVLSIPP